MPLGDQADSGERRGEDGDRREPRDPCHSATGRLRNTLNVDA